MNLQADKYRIGQHQVENILMVHASIGRRLRTRSPSIIYSNAAYTSRGENEDHTQRGKVTLAALLLAPWPAAADRQNVFRHIVPECMKLFLLAGYAPMVFGDVGQHNSTPDC